MIAPILDPVTGLPLDQYSGIVQQIPLGQQVFPFADLDADGRMTRQPIYGDDVLPTTALLTGQDTTGAARAGTMDTARRLYTREAVFQNLGAKIPDGETAPIDVNVVSGGGGGGGSTPFTTLYLSSSLQYTLTSNTEEWVELFNTPPLPATLWGIQMTVSTKDAVEYFTPLYAYLTNRHGSTSNVIPLLSADVWVCSNTSKPTFQYPYYSAMFSTGISLANLYNPATDYPILAARKVQGGNLDLQFTIWLSQ